MEFAPLGLDLAGLPPMLAQVGDQEILLPDSVQLEARATQCQVDCCLEIYQRRWHVFHLQSFYLRSSVAAIQRLARLARQGVVHEV